MGLNLVFLPFSCIHPVKPGWILEVLQLLLSPGVSEDICFPESVLPWVIFICRVGARAVSRGPQSGRHPPPPPVTIRHKNANEFSLS